ncbi:MAG: VWA domain-containing protein [Planctomycetales bacterium]|nr:VWA domain-containing protein [Planctomycetales bacterium]
MAPSDTSKADSSSEVLDDGAVVLPSKPPPLPKQSQPTKPTKRPAKAKGAGGNSPPGAAQSKPNSSAESDPKPKSDEKAREETADDEPEEAGPGVIADFLRGAPSWLSSLIVHMIALLVLALWTLAVPEEPVTPSLIASTSEVMDDFEELPDELEMEELEIETVSMDAQIQDPGEAMIGELNVETEATFEMSEIGNIDTSTVGEIGMLFGEDGQGMAEIGAGAGGAKFFGTRSSGRRFVFVVDNSNSMTKGRFETALNELVNTVEGFGPKQQFYVIFFSDTAYPLFHPQGAKGLVPATIQNKEMLRAWLHTVELCLRTKGEAAVSAALALRPDAIYILGDGAFTDKTREMILGQPKSIPIHTLGMEVDKRGETELKAIAKHTGGTYKAVGVHPAARGLAQKHPRKKNNTFGPIWGIELPKGKKKK